MSPTPVANPIVPAVLASPVVSMSTATQPLAWSTMMYAAEARVIISLFDPIDEDAEWDAVFASEPFKLMVADARAEIARGDVEDSPADSF
jgi:hypothetical protein